MEHHGWEFALESFVRVLGLLVWPITIIILIRMFITEVSGVIVSIQTAIGRIWKVRAKGTTVEFVRLPEFPPVSIPDDPNPSLEPRSTTKGLENRR